MYMYAKYNYISTLWTIWQKKIISRKIVVHDENDTITKGYFVKINTANQKFGISKIFKRN